MLSDNDELEAEEEEPIDTGFITEDEQEIGNFASSSSNGFSRDFNEEFHSGLGLQMNATYDEEHLNDFSEENDERVSIESSAFDEEENIDVNQGNIVFFL